MGRQRKKKSGESSREAQLRKRAASRGFTLEKDGDAWYAEISGTRFGPMRTLDDVDEFLPKDQ
jgi:hypothetical protein